MANPDERNGSLGLRCPLPQSSVRKRTATLFVPKRRQRIHSHRLASWNIGCQHNHHQERRSHQGKCSKIMCLYPEQHAGESPRDYPVRNTACHKPDDCDGCPGALSGGEHLPSFRPTPCGLRSRECAAPRCRQSSHRYRNKPSAPARPGAKHIATDMQLGQVDRFLRIELRSTPATRKSFSGLILSGETQKRRCL